MNIRSCSPIFIIFDCVNCGNFQVKCFVLLLIVIVVYSSNIITTFMGVFFCFTSPFSSGASSVGNVCWRTFSNIRNRMMAFKRTWKLAFFFIFHHHLVKPIFTLRCGYGSYAYYFIPKNRIFMPFLLNGKVFHKKRYFHNGSQPKNHLVRIWKKGRKKARN